MTTPAEHGPSDEELTAVVARMRRIRRQNRLAHFAACGALVVSAVGVWCIYAYGIFGGELSRGTGRVGMFLSASVAALVTRAVYTRLKSREVIDDDV